MTGKAAIPLVAGLCIGGFALKIGFDTLKSAKGAAPATVQLLAPKEDIARGVLVTEDMLQTLAFPAKLAPAGAISEKDKAHVVGRVTRTDAPAGIPMRESLLLPPGARAGLYVKPGFRAVAVKIDEASGVDFHLQPGCHVDVVGYFTINRDGKQETIARTLIENVEVAAVGPKLSASAGPDEDKSAKSKPARAVVLFVRPEDDDGLHLAEQRGKIKLSMRNDDDSGVETEHHTIRDREVILGEHESPSGDGGKPLSGLLAGLFGEKKETEPQSAAPPAAPPVIVAAPVHRIPTWDVVICQGGTKEVVRFKGPNTRERIEDGEAGATYDEEPVPQETPTAATSAATAPAHAADAKDARPQPRAQAAAKPNANTKKPAKSNVTIESTGDDKPEKTEPKEPGE